MTTYKQNAATINVDICAVPAEACVTGWGSLLASSKKIIRSGVVCNVSRRILKTGQGESCEISSLHVLFAKEIQTKKALFSQVKVLSGTYLWTVRNFLGNLIAQRAQTQRIFAKRYFVPNFTGNSLREPFLSTPSSHGCGASAWTVS